MFNMNTLPVNTSLTCSFQHSICPSWNLPYHCSVLLLNSEEGQWKSLTQSHSPTRHVLLYATHKGHYDTMAVMYSELDKNHDDIRCIYPYVSSGIIIISYYSLQKAQLCIERLRKETKGAFQVEYAKPCLINKKSNERLFVTISSDNCIIDLRKINYMHWCY
ncbi:uncharacterized protein B0P05DRAFT_129606 [Gilbertella persicaria]|uniref:uncharacterized protein n=1 Tax=Gilbertella persicaria TaxID=101096 RepID=UPI00221F81D4|nr:uncharacterized protein B0P05DRAFT_129606 [Gilbertella persicaria]KAI8077377.1 hypothetical protein B0P05DRAFT_129606 [Gilbertella persicaria]